MRFQRRRGEAGSLRGCPAARGRAVPAVRAVRAVRAVPAVPAR
ncbi:MAG: hypothetical protein R3F14_23720 [Polyangiaceae bacterium]